MRIHVTYTGGTIGMVETPAGLAPGADMRGWLNHVLEDAQVASARIAPEQVTFSTLDTLIDSSNATPDNWQAIVDDLWANREQADAFIVLHGTDTMSYSAAALSFALTEFDKPVIITGSQLPLGHANTDATSNVNGAISVALSGEAKGVNLFFGHRLLQGNRATKASSWAFEAFDAPATVPETLASAPGGWFHVKHAGCGWKNPKPYQRHDVLVVDMVPGVTAARIKHMMAPLPEAVILRAYGVGNVPSDEPGLVDIFAEAIEADVPVIITSQCHQARVLVGHYEAGDAIAKAGAVGAADMTLEAVYAKTVFLLSQGLRGRELSEWIGKSIAGELTEH